MKNRVMILLLASLMVIGSLSGCGSASNGEAETSAQIAEEETARQAEEETARQAEEETARQAEEEAARQAEEEAARQAEEEAEANNLSYDPTKEDDIYYVMEYYQRVMDASPQKGSSYALVYLTEDDIPELITDAGLFLSRDYESRMGTGSIPITLLF